MRDAHRMKEKYDLSLDNRQVVSLTIGALVVLGAVFVLGVVVGKKLAVSHEAANAQDLLSVLDARAQATPPEQEGEPPALTFPDELTRRTPAPVVAEAPAPKKPEPKPEPKAEPKPEPRPELEFADAPPPAKAAEPEKVVLAEAKKPQAAEAVPAALKVPAVAEAAPAKKPEPVPEKSAAVPTRTTDAASLKEAFAKAAVPSGTAANGAFTLQLSASQAREEAERFAQKLRERGYAPFIVTAEVPGKGTWYRVRMGRFANKEAASRYLADFRRETRLDAFVAPAN